MTEESSNYIVYVAYSQDGDECLYIGSGLPDRWKHVASGISHVYEANRYHFQGFTPRVVVEHSGLTKEQSLSLEKELIVNLNPRWNSVRYEASMARELSIAEKARRGNILSNQKILREYCDCCVSDDHKAHMGAYYTRIVPDLPDILDVLGYEKIQAYSFIWKDIQRLYRQEMELEKLKETSDRVLDFLGLEVGEFYTFKLLKDKMKALYAQNGVTATAKATDILGWYSCKKTNKRGQSGYLVESILGEQ